MNAPRSMVRLVLRMAQNETCDYGLFPDAAAAQEFARARIVEWCDGDPAREAAPAADVLAEWTAGCGEVFDIRDATKELN